MQDLEVSYRPIELRSLVDRAVLERRPITVQNIPWSPTGGESRSLCLTVTPLTDGTRAPIGVSLVFTDVTDNRRLQDELEQANQELEAAYEELRNTHEELETTNEELQSTIEELETTNEELQSTNEELETMNEELQSTNEELQTTNDELRLRTEELHGANAFFEAVLTGLRGGVAVVDRELRLTGWNRQSEELWGLRSDEVRGQHLLNLDIGLPVVALRPALRSCLAGELPADGLVLDAVNRRGRAFRCKVTCTPLIDVASGESRGAIVLMEPADGAPTDGARAQEPA
jgi:two-component system CheB/CheR fusion protein